MSFSSPRKSLPNNRTGQNLWIVSGKVVKKEVKYSEAGNCVANITLEIPTNNPKYKAERHRLVAFKETAEEISNRIEEGQNWCFKASVKNNVYEKEGKKVYEKSLIINKFETAVEVDPEGDVVATQSINSAQSVPAKEAQTDDIPF